MPTSDSFVRRLRAIAVIDIAGYSKLMAAEEARTHARVNDLFGRVVDPAISDHSGRRIERAGDGLLVLFESSTDAVRCAVAIQRIAEQHGSAVPPERRLRMRIGINVGDIIIDGDEVAGDDVNIAARLQALAEPGTVCISAAVRSQLHEEFDSTFEDLGEVELKNIGRSVHVYQLRVSDRKGPFARWRQQRRPWRLLLSRRRTALLVSLATLVTGVVVVTTWLPYTRSTRGEPPPMSVAVLPFKADPGNGLVDIGDPIARGLAATGWLQVAGPDSAQRMASQAQPISALRGSLNVRYVVRGRIEDNNRTLAADVELVDTSTGLASWTTRVLAEDRPGTMSIMATNLVVKLREAIYEAEARRFFESGRDARTAMEYKMLGDSERAHFLTLATERKSRVHYEKSLSIDPNFVPSMVSLAYALLSEFDLDPSAPAGHLIEEVDEISKRAIAHDPNSAPVWQLRSEALARQWLWDAALEASDRSLGIDPGRAFGHGQRASLLLRLGKPREALEIADRAAALAEQRSGFVMFQRCRALMALAEYRGAAEACQKSISSEEWWLQRAYLLSAYALLDDAGNASSEKIKLLHQQPQMSIARVRVLRQSNVKEFEQQLESHFLRGLRRAGIPEGS